MMNFKKAIVISCCLLGVTAHAQVLTPVTEVQITMREHGYHLGDILVQKVVVPHQKAQSIDQKSLPLPGPIKPWLDLREIHTAPVEGGTALTLYWQVFATVEAAQQLQLPGWRLSLKGHPAVPVNIKPTAFFHSPVFSSNVTEIERKPTRPPLQYDVSIWQWLTISALMVSLFSAGAALWVQDRLPWWPFQPGPLCWLHRQFKKRSNSAIEDKLTMAYRSICLAAGTTLHRQNIALLFKRAPYLQALQPEIEHFVSSYSDYQFGHQSLIQAESPTIERKEQLLRQLQSWLPQAALLERNTGKMRSR